MGRLTEAEDLARDLLDRRRRLLGADNPQTLASIDLLAGLIMSQGREREAVPYQREVLEGRTRILGEQHAATLLTMGNLGATLIRLGELEEAETLTRRALAAHTEKFGRENSRTMVLLANLAYLLEDRGRRAEAVEIYREIIAIRTAAANGAADPEVWPSMNNLAMILTDLDRLEEADAMFTELLGLCSAMVPETHYALALFRNNHGATLTAMGRHDAARAALDASHPVLEGFFGSDHERTRRSRDRMTELDRASNATAGR
jgi:tetratricopeptide (TPR) repeat protein